MRVASRSSRTTVALWARIRPYVLLGENVYRLFNEKPGWLTLGWVASIDSYFLPDRCRRPTATSIIPLRKFAISVSSSSARIRQSPSCTGTESACPIESLAYTVTTVPVPGSDVRWHAPAEMAELKLQPNPGCWHLQEPPRLADLQSASGAGRQAAASWPSRFILPRPQGRTPAPLVDLAPTAATGTGIRGAVSSASHSEVLYFEAALRRLAAVVDHGRGS
jgi:hypothetical protein